MTLNPLEKPETTWAGEFERFFQTPVALEAGRPLAAGAQIRLKLRASPQEAVEADLLFRRTRSGQEIRLVSGLDPKEISPQLTFELSLEQARTILTHPTHEVGSYGVLIVREIFHSQPEARIRFQLHAGFLTLFRLGYWGVLTAGGPSFASELASRGFSGMNAIKSALQKLRASP